MKRKIKPLSFEPVYHRRISQGNYIRLQLKATKSLSMETVNAVKAERQAILDEGFTIGEFDVERPSRSIAQADKGDVAAVIANTNPDFKIQFKEGMQ